MIGRWASFALLAVLACPAAASIESRPVQFAKGASSATLKGSIKGDQTIDYKLRARAGQTMSVSMQAKHTAAYFNVMPPGSKGEAIFVGSSGGNEWSGALPADGEYVVRVYLMRSAARRAEAASYTLTIGVTGSALPAGAAPKSDAKVAGTPFHATGKVPCSLGNAPAGSMQCDFGVIRGKPGHAVVHVTPPGGLEQVLSFAGDKVSTSGGGKVKATISSKGVWTIDVNDYEHYSIPESVVSGG